MECYGILTRQTSWLYWSVQIIEGVFGKMTCREVSSRFMKHVTSKAPMLVNECNNLRIEGRSRIFAPKGTIPCYHVSFWR